MKTLTLYQRARLQLTLIRRLTDMDNETDFSSVYPGPAEATDEEETNPAIPLTRMKTLPPMPMIIISDPPEEETSDEPTPDETPTCPGNIIITACQVCSDDFGRDANCPSCQGLRLVHTLTPIPPRMP